MELTEREHEINRTQSMREVAERRLTEIASGSAAERFDEKHEMERLIRFAEYRLVHLEDSDVSAPVPSEALTALAIEMMDLDTVGLPPEQRLVAEVVRGALADTDIADLAPMRETLQAGHLSSALLLYGLIASAPPTDLTLAARELRSSLDRVLERT